MLSEEEAENKVDSTVSQPEKDEDGLFAIPGLGVDGRVYGRMVEHLPLQVIEWLEPEAAETLSQYALRMAHSLPSGQPVWLLGYSFGGVVAQEIARLRPGTQLILINTLCRVAEKPTWLQVARYLPFYQLARGSWRIRSLPLWAPRYGVTDAAEQQLLADMFRSASDRQRMWAIRQLCHWQGGREQQGVVCLRLHGEDDQVFPVGRIQGARVVPGGRHFMIWQQAERLAEIILDYLQKHPLPV